MQLAREWIYNNIAAEKYGKGSVNKVILFGHSSGGAHIATNLYAAGKKLCIKTYTTAIKLSTCSRRSEASSARSCLPASGWSHLLKHAFLVRQDETYSTKDATAILWFRC